ncbi:MAG: CDP-glycerol glycerophosphotransferase family protein, partial [Lachnospiraceae bacterium]|nr:CDP-glycerol glycerophosphotransferase family protein [Lachnospiraceae bacterium]
MAEKVFIKNIEWDRIWISFFIEGLDETSNVFISNSKRTYSFSLKNGDAPDEYKLNITNPGDCKMLPTGIYELFYNSSDKELPGASYNINWNNPSIEVKTLSKQFIYFHNERAYRIQFTDKNGFKFKASDVQLKGQGTVKNLLSIIRRTKNNTAKTILRTIYNFDYILFHRKLRGKDIHKIKDPRILLMSDQSEEMGSNMVALKNALIREGLNPKEALRAITTKHYNILHWMKTLKKIAWADYIFLDDHSQTTDWLTIKGAVITQLWHAGAGFKSTGYSRFGMPASPAPKSGHRQYTYGIAGSKKIRHFFSEVWGINDEMVLPTGMPRLDEYLDENYIEETA